MRKTVAGPSCRNRDAPAVGLVHASVVCNSATAICLALSLAACQTPAVREVTVTKEVPAPYAAPCPKPENKPILPKRVAEEHPQMPADPAKQARILASKILEWLTYGEAADGIMTACSRLK